MKVKIFFMTVICGGFVFVDRNICGSILTRLAMSYIVASLR